HELLGDQSWGVGILGFLPPEIRKEQIDEILQVKPPFAIIAGGRPDQASEFEEQGIPTYLHVPSPGLLRMFLRDGARRFIFEGRECGGHVGPRGSFLLWESMCDVLLEHLGPNARGQDLHLVFAGGIHDANSAAMVAAMAAPLAKRGARIGALMGTAYLYTQEAVDKGAIVPQFQESAITCDDTVLLETAPGHAVRCIRTPYFKAFQVEKNRLQGEGKSHDEIVRALEWMNIGRLRIASKGLDRVSQNGGPSKLAEISQAEQLERGMYMIGQVSTLRSGRTTMAELHADVSAGSVRLLNEVSVVSKPQVIEQKPCDIAIIGMDCVYPGADDVTSYWNNILDRTDAVVEIPQTHWDWEVYYDKDPRARDKIISKWGGFVGDLPFNPLQYGITPASMRCIEPLQLLLLESVRRALDSAGYANRPFNRERAAAVLGIGGGGSPMATMYGFRTCLPMFRTMVDLPDELDAAIERGKDMLPEWTEDSVPGFLFNVAVGRVANRFNFGGTNMAIDAACASSLAAVHACVRELESGTADFAVAMGADTVSTPFAYMAFSKTHALSARGRCSPFDAAADGIVLSEGIGVVVLKRLADAQRDGDKIYGIIKGVGSSSDGKEKGLTAPNASGQLRALRRAYAQAGFSPSKVELIEAHGTGTVVGDRTEAESLATVMSESGADLQSCALGSVKSMIGHSKCAAGIAGLIKTTQAIHRKVLPPMLVDQPNPKVGFDKTPLYLNTEARPWIHRDGEPRRAGVSAFGFGGTNFHVVLEEYCGDYLQDDASFRDDWPAELVVFRRKTREALGEA
ncbi:MAG: beta-ketoacyl synthase N-terminal-like domain-containing protein, partial [Pirellulales bacterium]